MGHYLFGFLLCDSLFCHQGPPDYVVDVHCDNASESFLAAASEAMAARLLKGQDDDRAAYSLKRAREDWEAAVDAMRDPQVKGTPIEIASAGALASVDLYRVTGQERYAQKAVELAKAICDSQQRDPIRTTPPLSGFFYTSPAREQILHYYHRTHEQTPIVALAKLIETMPAHSDSQRWREAIRAHAAYLKALAKVNEPYGMFSASIYTEDEYKTVPERRRDAFREQVLNGIPLGSGYRLRRFPVWFDFRGNYGLILSQTKALSTAARVLGDDSATALARRQLEWVVGRNPFAQSTMYGEGHDFAPQFSVMSGDIVGSLPVGIETRGNSDAPYWPVQNCYTYKEVWVHPVSRWMWILADFE